MGVRQKEYLVACDGTVLGKFSAEIFMIRTDIMWENWGRAAG